MTRGDLWCACCSFFSRYCCVSHLPPRNPARNWCHNALMGVVCRVARGLIVAANARRIARSATTNIFVMATRIHMVGRRVLSAPATMYPRASLRRHQRISANACRRRRVIPAGKIRTEPVFATDARRFESVGMANAVPLRLTPPPVATTHVSSCPVTISPRPRSPRSLSQLSRR